MSSSKDAKFEQDAKRASTRGFGGYLKDRITGSADFEKAKTPSTAGAGTLGGSNPANKKSWEEAGYKRGGSVKAPAAKAPMKRAPAAKSAPKKSNTHW
jgi:hypothetical protein